MLLLMSFLNYFSFGGALLYNCIIYTSLSSLQIHLYIPLFAFDFLVSFLLFIVVRYICVSSYINMPMIFITVTENKLGQIVGRVNRPVNKRIRVQEKYKSTCVYIYQKIYRKKIWKKIKKTIHLL